MLVVALVQSEKLQSARYQDDSNSEKMRRVFLWESIDSGELYMYVQIYLCNFFDCNLHAGTR